MLSGQDAGCMPDVPIEGENCFVVKCFEVCSCVLVHTVLGDVWADATTDLDMYSYNVPRESVFGI